MNIICTGHDSHLDWRGDIGVAVVQSGEPHGLWIMSRQQQGLARWTYVLQELERNILKVLANVREPRITMAVHDNFWPGGCAGKLLGRRNINVVGSAAQQCSASLNTLSHAELGVYNTDVILRVILIATCKAVGQCKVVLNKNASRDPGDEHAAHERVQSLWLHVTAGKHEVSAAAGRKGSVLRSR